MAATASLQGHLLKNASLWSTGCPCTDISKAPIRAAIPLHSSSKCALPSFKAFSGKQLNITKVQQKHFGRQPLNILAAVGPNAGTYDPADPNAEPGQTAIVVADEFPPADTVPSDVEPIEGSEVTKGPTELSTKDLKQQLVDTLYGTDRGLRASSETRAEITEIISQLEAANPNPAPTEKLELLNGKWNLAYTSFSELYPLLAASNLPGIEVGEISQSIDTYGFTATNAVQYKGPLGSNSFSVTAAIEVRSPKRIQIRFEEGTINTPNFNDGFQFPKALGVFGQQLDISPLDTLTKPLQDAAASVARMISGQPPLKFPIRNGANSDSWLLTTYLDEDLRISRGDGGGLFVLLKEGTMLS
ncbi:hypothetical protein KFL_004680020 [Klebsormidium nitens]|uniref:Plastid lipid-associated protein/fibrillin conserved domain-containing protein n=1 Tax=Klebsormidium nitens TaxID=105231 RepID=A0A1Y1ILA9_KLENI|nr:hypothetical protein KFL_004680020 [Klebsormidium nitens]|eukprot:GAQ88898.1 hypothetical protein KFL_004680020 [Klebsormidium nitens]